MLIHLLLMLLVYGLIFSLLYYVVTLIPLPPPFAMVARAVLAVIAVILIIALILPLANEGVACGNRLIC